MKIELNANDGKRAIRMYLKNELGIETELDEIQTGDSYLSVFATWEKKEEVTDGE